MTTRISNRLAALAAAVLLWSLLQPAALRAEDEDYIEKAGVAVGLTAGNMWAVPLKAISMSMGAFTGALSFVLSGGNAELTRQIWRDTFSEPYVITPELAKKAVGTRPELSNKQ